MQKAIIIGATSGIGQEVARILVQQGWHIGIDGRREEALHALQATAPDRIVTEQLDATEETATLHLHNLIKKRGGIDLFFHSSGIIRITNSVATTPILLFRYISSWIELKAIHNATKIIN